MAEQAYPPEQGALGSSDARGAWGVQFGNYNVQHNEFYLQPPCYRLDPIKLSAPADPGWLLRVPSRLLDARAEVVPFTGREAELRELAQWRDGPAGFLAVRLMHGAGGQGKTRLANRFAVQSAKDGWNVLTARYDSAAREMAATETARPDGAALAPAATIDTDAACVLLLVDYADRWPHTQLVRLFTDPALRRARQARVLLIGRSVQWWAAIRGELADLRAEADERRLTSLGATAADRERLFNAARDRFAELLDAALPGAPTAPATPVNSESQPAYAAAPVALTNPGSSAYAAVLTVHMAALAAAYAGQGGASLPDRPEALAAYLLDREHMTWRRLFDAGPPFRTPPRELARVVFVATLTGALPQKTGLAALQVTGLELVQGLLDDHRLCYPPFDAGTVLEPLYPDRLAEDFLALSLPGHGVESHDPDPWAIDALASLLTRDPGGAAPAYTARSVTFLAAAAVRWPHVATVVDAFLRADPGLAVDAGGAGLTAVAETPGLGIDVLNAVVARFPDSSKADLDGGMAAVVDRLSRDLLSAAEDEPSRLIVRLNEDIPFRLINAGRFADAVDVLRESIPWWRRLAAGDAKDAVVLANALSMLSAALLSCGQIPEAAEAGRESVEIYRRSSADGNDLGSALATYSNALLGSGRLQAALDTATEAAQLHQSRTARDDFANANLAIALCNQSSTLADLGQTSSALQAIEAALGLWRALAGARPATWEPGLAMALNRAAACWAQNGRRQRALDASLESAAIYRRMAEANPAAHRRALAGVLSDLGRDLAAVGRDGEALDASLEAVALRRTLAAGDRLAHEPDLAAALNNLSTRLESLGRQDESLAAIQEAVAIQRRLAATAPETHEPGLANGLTNLAAHLQRGGRPTEALLFAREAVAIQRRLAATGIVARRADLARSLERLARVCDAVGRTDESVDAATQALTAYLELTGNTPGAPQSAPANGEPDMHRPALAGAFMTLHHCLAAAGQSSQALHACEEAVHLLLELAPTDPPRLEPDLAAGFSNLSGALQAVGRHAEAGGTAQNAIMIFRRLAGRDPARYNRWLATAHHNLGVILSSPPAPHDLVSASAEAVKDLRRLTDTDPEFTPDLAMALSKLSIALAATGHWSETLAAAHEAVTLRRRLASTDPITHEPHLARLLRGLATALLVGGVAPTQAATMARESLAIYQQLAGRDPATYGDECQQAVAEITKLLKSRGMRP